MVFDVDCAIGIMNHIINNQKVEDGKLNIFYCKHFYEADKLKKYDKDIIYYAILMLHQGGYIDAKINKLANNKQKIDSVKGLTLRGHEFCEHMKEPTVSKRVKNGFKALGKHSLAALTEKDRREINDSIIPFCRHGKSRQKMRCFA